LFQKKITKRKARKKKKKYIIIPRYPSNFILLSKISNHICHTTRFSMKVGKIYYVKMESMIENNNYRADHLTTF